MDPLNDPKAHRAAEALLLYINTQRRMRCLRKPLLAGPPKLLYATHGYVGGEKSQYRLEILAGMYVCMYAFMDVSVWIWGGETLGNISGCVCVHVCMYVYVCICGCRDAWEH
jgi:hypothetical protein